LPWLRELDVPGRLVGRSGKVLTLGGWQACRSYLAKAKPRLATLTFLNLAAGALAAAVAAGPRSAVPVCWTPFKFGSISAMKTFSTK
jgi:hypothetical protein